MTDNQIVLKHINETQIVSDWITNHIELYIDNDQILYEYTRKLAIFHNKEDLDGLAIELKQGLIFYNKENYQVSRLLVLSLPDILELIDWKKIAKNIIEELKESE